MKIAILCSDVEHPIFPYLREWSKNQSALHKVQLAQSKKELDGGDILFLISCHEIIGKEVRKLYNASLLIHASDLPEGRGWSPHIWQILEGKNKIPVTLLEVEDQVDSGAIWSQIYLNFEGHETSEEINRALFKTELELMNFAVNSLGKITPRRQDNRVPTYYRKRTPEDSRLDPHGSIAEQFDLIRVADPKRFPVFFDYRGCRYALSITKVDRNDRS